MKFGNNENWNGHLKTKIEKWKFSNNDEFARNVFWKMNTFEKGNNFEKNVIRKISKYFKTFFSQLLIFLNWILKKKEILNDLNYWKGENFEMMKILER